MTRNEIHKGITDYLALFENDCESAQGNPYHQDGTVQNDMLNLETREERVMLALDRQQLVLWGMDGAKYSTQEMIRWQK